MNETDDILFKTILDRVLNETTLTARFLQYHHVNRCGVPCKDCPNRDKRIYENGTHVKLPAHPHCDCYYTNVKTKQLGTISKRQPPPDVWLKQFGHLPDYYITKEDAMKIYGWDPSKNTLAGKAPGKMIGDEIYENKPVRLPVKNGRTWKYCDVDYESGKRNNLRLFYSSDGLMFYSTDHGDKEFYWII